MNMQRFRQVLAYIEAHPEKWDQGGFSQCLIAHASRMAGATQIMSRQGHEWLGLTWGTNDWWFYKHDRTLDDFRTIARRPFA